MSTQVSNERKFKIESTQNNFATQQLSPGFTTFYILILNRVTKIVSSEKCTRQFTNSFMAGELNF